MKKQSVSLFWSQEAWTGLFLGAVLAALLMQPLRLLPGSWPLSFLAVCLYAALMTAGWTAGKKREIFLQRKTKKRSGRNHSVFFAHGLINSVSGIIRASGSRAGCSTRNGC